MTRHEEAERAFFRELDLWHNHQLTPAERQKKAPILPRLGPFYLLIINGLEFIQDEHLKLLAYDQQLGLGFPCNIRIIVIIGGAGRRLGFQRVFGL